MQLFCPACQAAFPGTQRCPRCGGLLLLPQEAAEASAQRLKSAPPPRPVQPAPLGRVVVGAVMALGMYLGLRKLATGAVLAAHPDPDAWWVSFEGLATICGGQAVAVLFGAVVAAAGRTNGFLFGVGVGGACGGLFLAAELVAGAPPQDLVLYIQPLVLVLVGGIAGAFAARVWGAVPLLDMPVVDRNTLSSAQFGLTASPEPGRPTAWIRIMAGAMIMLASIAVADKVRSGAQKYSGGALRVTSVGQARFLTWQLAVLGILGGGVIAGASTGAGLRHGFIAGGLGAVGVLGLTISAGEPLGPVSYWLSTLSLGHLAPNDPTAIMAALSGVLFLGILGGWLGGTLFLPLGTDRKRMGPALD